MDNCDIDQLYINLSDYLQSYKSVTPQGVELKEVNAPHITILNWDDFKEYTIKFYQRIELSDIDILDKLLSYPMYIDQKIWELLVQNINTVIGYVYYSIADNILIVYESCDVADLIEELLNKFYIAIYDEIKSDRLLQTKDILKQRKEKFKLALDQLDLVKQFVIANNNFCYMSKSQKKAIAESYKCFDHINAPELKQVLLEAPAKNSNKYADYREIVGKYFELFT